ncbi:hypothetical protein C0J52_12460 [Blattella germanica]|nr:hypothetical protein C0J52_12460 [Blattella germanica]
MIRGSSSYKNFGNWPTRSWSFRGSKFAIFFLFYALDYKHIRAAHGSLKGGGFESLVGFFLLENKI